jgi:TM2 domain-containing membrane protein YozV
MAEICPVCTRSISFITKETIEGINLHVECIEAFLLNPEKYGGKAIKKTEAQIKAEKEHKEHQKKEPSDKDFITTLLICVFLGGLGVHRCFVDKMGTGILMLVTLGGLGIWWIIDIILIVTGSFEDSEGRVIAYQAAGTANREPAKDIPAEIRKFAELKKDGLISEEEFDKKKEELLR